VRLKQLYVRTIRHVYLTFSVKNVKNYKY